MSTVGQRERATQQRLIQFFVEDLGYRHLSHRTGYTGNSNIDTNILSAWLKRRGVNDTLITRRCGNWIPPPLWAKAKTLLRQ